MRLGSGIEWLITVTDIAPDGLSAQVFGEELTAESPAALANAISSLYYRRGHAGLVERPADRAEILSPSASIDTGLEQRLRQQLPATAVSTELDLLEDLGAVGVIADYRGLRTLFPQVIGRRGSRVLVPVPSCSARLTPGFLFYTSSHGADAGGRPLRLYRHLTCADEAVQVWERLLGRVEQWGLPMRCKVLSNRDSFPRNDALVLYLGPQSWHRVPDLVDLLECDERPRSPFAHALAPGVSMAWEPIDPVPSRLQTSFGEHRSRVLAKALVGTRQLDPVARRRQLALALTVANIDPAAPYRNLDSPHLPGPLTLPSDRTEPGTPVPTNTE